MVNPDHKQYTQLYMLSLRDIFPNNPELAKKLIQKRNKSIKGPLKLKYGCKDNSALVRQIIKEALKMAVFDVMAGNCKFMMPGTSTGYIHIGKRSDEVLKHKVANGTNPFDLIATNKTFPRVRYNPSSGVAHKHLNIFVSGKRYQDFIDRANTGIPFSKVPKTIQDFYPALFDRFPTISKTSIKIIVTRYLRVIGKELKRRQTLRVTDRECEIRIYDPLGRGYNYIMEKRFNRRKEKLESLKLEKEE